MRIVLGNRSSPARHPSEGWPAIGLAVVAGSLAVALAASAQESTSAASAVDRAFQAFWAASNPASAAGRIDAILKTGVSFEDALARVRRGRDHDADVPRGLQVGRHRTFDGVDQEFVFIIPRTYDASRPYQVRFQLHGGIARARPPAVNRVRTDVLPSGVDEILVFPIGWVRALWWSATQVDNLARILDRLKRTYNVDENRVYLTGVSDGGTGVYFMAFRDVTPWASFLPLIGHMAVLAHSVGPRRWRDVSRQRRQQAALCRQYRTGSDVSGARDADLRGTSAQARRQRGVSRVSRTGPFNGVVAERPPGIRVVRARQSTRAAARPDFVADRTSRSVQPRALADHRSAWRR